MSEETNQEEREFTEQEIREMQDKTIKFYKGQEKILSIQCTVEELKARIKKAQFDSFEYSIKLMQLNHAMKEAEEEAAETLTEKEE